MASASAKEISSSRSSSVLFAVTAAVVVARDASAQTGVVCGMSGEGMAACRPSVGTVDPPVPLEKPSERGLLLCAEAGQPAFRAFGRTKNSALWAMQILPAKCDLNPQHC